MLNFLYNKIAAMPLLLQRMWTAFQGAWRGLSLHKPKGFSPPAPATSNIEEGTDVYRPGHFHPVYIGDIYNGRYQILNKLGYGVYSTVWLVKDLKSGPDEVNPYRAMKILSAECYGTKHDVYEREILRHLRDADTESTGYDFICHLLDDFEHKGPNGNHVCFIFEPMGETLETFPTWFWEKEYMLPSSVMVRFAIQLIIALDYAHDNGVIHTDIKPDNIFVKFRDFSLIASKYLAEVKVPEQKRDGPYIPIRSNPLKFDYFPLGGIVDFSEFDISLGDWGVASWKDKHLCEVIQPRFLRSPEVIIGAEWDESTDWWNFGVVLLELYRAVRLFDGAGPPDGRYSAKIHLAQIVSQFGSIPRKFLDRGDPEIVNEMFNEDGTLKFDEPMEWPKLESDEYMRGLDGETKEQFLSFMELLMKIDPKERPESMELLGHLWLNALIYEEP